MNENAQKKLKWAYQVKLIFFFETGCHYVAQPGLELASRVLGFQVCTTTPSLNV
jgi:hypothetical protein